MRYADRPSRFYIDTKMTKLSVALAALKSEIRQLAKSEAKSLVAPLQKTVASLKSEVAVLKKQAKLRGAATRPERLPEPLGADEAENFEFNAKRFKANRKRLKLSAADCGLMLDTTGATVYNWENKGMLPRSSGTLQRVRALQQIGSPADARAIVDEIKQLRGAS